LLGACGVLRGGWTSVHCGECFLFVIDAAGGPAGDRDRQDVFEHGERGVLRARAESGCGASADAPGDAIAPPCQSLELAPAGLRSALADGDVAAPFEGELLPACVGGERQIEAPALPLYGIERRDLLRGPLVGLLRLFCQTFANTCAGLYEGA